jgi:hypothetical protein
MKKIKQFFGFIANRGLSGLLNGLFYATGVGSALSVVLVIITISTLFVTLIPMIDNWHSLTDWQRVLSIIGVVASLVSIIALSKSFYSPKWKYADIHLYTFLHQTAISGTNWFSKVKIGLLLLCVSPSVFLQKVLINLIPGNKWNYQGTDVVSGKYWSLKLFPRIKIPRLRNMAIKLVITILSIITFLVIHHFQKKHIINIDIV